MEEALNYPGGSFQEYVTDGELGPWEELFGGEWAQSEFGREAMGVGNFAPDGTKSSVEAPGSIPLNGNS